MNISIQVEINQIVADATLNAHQRTRALTSLFFGYGQRATVQDAARVLIAIEQQATLALLDMEDASRGSQRPSGY